MDGVCQTESSDKETRSSSRQQERVEERRIVVQSREALSALRDIGLAVLPLHRDVYAAHPNRVSCSPFVRCYTVAINMHWIAPLWSSSAAWEHVEYTAEAIVIIGCIFEGLADFKIILKSNDSPREHVEKVAFFVLVAGLALGLIALVRTNQLFTATITDLYGQARDANNRAVTASDKATKAQDRADKASAHEEELETRTEHEINARLTLEKLTTWEGPRFLPLRWAEGQFTSELRSFAGQHFAISVCTRDVDQTQGDMRETEIGTAWEAMEFVLHQARWELAGGRLEYLQDNCLSSRITVRATKEATKRTCDAALSLQRVINEALGDNVAGGCDGTAYITQRIFPRPERTEPGPDVVEVHIGKHPAQPLAARPTTSR